MDATARRALAYHEAGHAVIGRVLQMPCGSATIVPDDDAAGHSITNNPMSSVHYWEMRGRYRDYKTGLRAMIIAHMAGRAAEIEFFGDCQGGDGDDRHQIAEMAASLVRDQDWPRWEARLLHHTATLVARHRVKIGRLASALMERGTLTPDEIDALL
jgi:ATP-dependent Zn protease